MLKNYKNIIIVFLFVIFLSSLIIIENVLATNQNNTLVSVIQEPIKPEDVNKRIIIESKNQIEEKPLQEIVVSDVTQDEKISTELRARITRLLNQSQYEMDNYRTTIETHYKQVDAKFIEFKKSLNKVENFKDQMEYNLNLSKWMIISLSIGIICLTAIVLIMWKSVINVNRNDVELIFSAEKIKKSLRILEKRIELLEVIYKKNG